MDHIEGWTQRPTLRPSSCALCRAMGLLVICHCHTCCGDDGDGGIVNSSTSIDGVGDIHMHVEL